MFFSSPFLGPSIGRDSWRKKGPTEFETFHIGADQKQQESQHQTQNTATLPDKPAETSIGIRPFRLADLVSSINEPINEWLTFHEASWMPSIVSRRSLWHQTDLYWLHKYQLRFDKQMQSIATHQLQQMPIGFSQKNQVLAVSFEDQSPQRLRNDQQEEAAPRTLNQSQLHESLLDVVEREEEELEDADYMGLEVAGDEILMNSSSESEIMVTTGTSRWDGFRSDSAARLDPERDPRIYPNFPGRNTLLPSEEEMSLDSEISRNP